MFAKPVSTLFNLAINNSIFPDQWKTAFITPIAKISIPTVPADFRPISITPVLSRVLEKLVVRTYIYPVLHNPKPPLSFSDQYAFRPTGSTTGALIHLLQVVTDMLRTNTYARVFALDFSKAFDSVRHSSLTSKLSMLEIPDTIYNWIIEFLSGRKHCTKFQGVVSSELPITASVIQGSALGPSLFAVTASDMHPINKGNVILKFADDTYLIIPESLSSTSQSELANIEQWSLDNNLKLNRNKSYEILFHPPRSPIPLSRLPSEISGVKRVSSLKCLGVVLSHNLSISEHISNILCSCQQSLYALKLLRAYGLSEFSLSLIFTAIVLSKITYASPA